MQNIPFFDYPRLYKDNRDEIISIIDEVALRGAFILQKDVAEFERSLEKYTGARYSIGVGNATDGLEICLASIGLHPGDEVICSAHTMLATASAIATSGGVPVPVDIGPDGLIDPSAVEAAITSKTVGIMPTQLNGRTCDMDSILQIAKKYGLFIVEDAAQALGSKFKNKSAGTFGHASAISFYPAKILGCFGDAGAILTNDDSAYNKMYQMHDHGRDLSGEVKSWGRNSRLDNIQAAILNYNFRNYDEVVDRRRAIAKIYNENLSSLDCLVLPPAPRY